MLSFDFRAEIRFQVSGRKLHKKFEIEILRHGTTPSLVSNSGYQVQQYLQTVCAWQTGHLRHGTTQSLYSYRGYQVQQNLQAVRAYLCALRWVGWWSSLLSAEPASSARARVCVCCGWVGGWSSHFQQTLHFNCASLFS